MNLIDNIEFLFEEADSCCAMGIFYRGHCDIMEFCQSYNNEYNYKLGDRRFATPDKVRQCWARNVPNGTLAYTNKPGHGAWPITVFEW